MRGSLAIVVFAACFASACDAPANDKPVGAAEVAPPPQREPLPKPVADTVRLLTQVAEQGGPRDLARLASTTESFRSNNAGMSHAEYWGLKGRTGDPPGPQLSKVLAYRFTVADSPQGKVYIWPYMAMLKPDEIGPADAREIDKLLGPGMADQLRKGGIWPGYVLGIREDGLWLYFVSGSG